MTDGNPVHERDGGRCVAQVPGACRRDRRAETVNHRIHGDHNARYPPVLMSVCGDGTRGCHGWIERHPTLAAARGWWVYRRGHHLPVPYPARADPADVPMWYANGPFGPGWYWLDPANGFSGWPTGLRSQAATLAPPPLLRGEVRLPPLVIYET